MSSKDRLSMLPEEMVSHILSLMPTKFAVRTSILSKRWRYTWMSVTNLDFDDIHPNHGSYILSKFVDGVMDSCKPSQIQLFRLRFSEGLVRESRASKWIDKAVGLNVCELDIDVIELKLPLSMFTCKTLTKLTIHRSIDDNSVCPSSVYLPCLKTLDMAVYNDRLANAFHLIHGCPMLESLSFEVIRRDKHEEDYLFNIPTLKRLKLTWRCLGFERVVNKCVLRTPNLEYLFVDGIIMSSVFVIEDASSLVEACVSLFRFNYLWIELLKGLSGVIKSLSVQQTYPSSFVLPIFPGMKHLELKGFQNSEVVVIQFLESCPELKHLYIEEEQGFVWVGSKRVPGCMLTSLTTIKFSICKEWRYDIPFLKYMLGNAKVLKTITITWKYSNNIEEERQLCANLLRLHRASRYCEIRLHGNWSHSTIN